MVMAMKVSALSIISFLFITMLQLSHGQPQGFTAPSPAPGPSSDGAAIDQGIAYVLLLVALAITYLVH